MSVQRIRRVSNKKEMERLVDDFLTMGYVIDSQGEDNVRVIKKAKKDKHGLIALLTVWWTFGIGNIIYACMPAKNSDEVLIKIDNMD